MKGDFSRLNFKPANSFHGVMLEQGRVQLDSDWNEAGRIANYLENLTLEDTIGMAGTPIGATGFLLTPPLLDGGLPVPEKSIMKAIFQPPQNLPGAAVYLQNGIAYLKASDTIVSETLVYRMDVFLVFVAGDGEQPITFAESDLDRTTIYQLGLDNVQPVALFAFKNLEPSFQLTSKQPQVSLGFASESGEAPTMRTVNFHSVPGTPETAALALQAAIREVPTTDINFTMARVLVRGDRLVVVPGDWISEPVFKGTEADPTTVYELLLDEGDDPEPLPEQLLGSRSASLANFPRVFDNPEPMVRIIYSGTSSFQLVLTTYDTRLTQGRFYLDGMLAQNLVPNLPYEHQPFFPSAQLPSQLGDFNAILLGWLRSVNDIQYPGIREIALGGPDTSTRIQAVWQVRMVPQSFTLPPALPANAMLARLEAGNATLGNHYYLIEIQQGGEITDLATAEVTPVTIKWSRNNGAVVFGILNVSLGEKITTMILDNLGQDISLSLNVGDWVEICCDYYQLQAIPAPIVRIESVDPDRSIITISSPTDPSFPMVLDSFFTNGFIRRWDQQGLPENLVGGTIALQPWDESQPQWVAIENGIQVAFLPGTYRNGSYWNFTSRSADNAISWPVDKAGKPLPQDPAGPVLHTTLLGEAKHTQRRWTFSASKTLPVFQNLTQISSKVGDIDELKKEVAELKAKVEAMEAQVQENTEAIATLDQRVDQLDDTVAQLQTQVDQNTEAIAELNAKVAALEEAISKLEGLPAKVAALEQRVEYLTQLIVPLLPLPGQFNQLENSVVFNGNQNLLAETTPTQPNPDPGSTKAQPDPELDIKPKPKAKSRSRSKAKAKPKATPKPKKDSADS